MANNDNSEAGLHWPPSVGEKEKAEICRFARYLFPDITDAEIAEDFDIFREQYRTRGWLDGHRTVLRRDDFTGQIYQAVIWTKAKEENS